MPDPIGLRHIADVLIRGTLLVHMPQKDVIEPILHRPKVQQLVATDLDTMMERTLPDLLAQRKERLPESGLIAPDLRTLKELSSKSLSEAEEKCPDLGVCSSKQNALPLKWLMFMVKSRAAKLKSSTKLCACLHPKGAASCSKKIRVCQVPKSMLKLLQSVFETTKIQKRPRFVHDFTKHFGHLW